MGEVYKIEYPFSTADADRYNAGGIDDLYVIYRGGQVAFVIHRERKEHPFGSHIMKIEYRNRHLGKELMGQITPREPKASDF